MRLALAVLIAALTVAIAAPAGVAATKTVVLKDIKFKPGTVQINRGSRVRWVWRDPSTPHNVKSRGKRRFRSSGTKQSGTHTVRFRRRGTYRYVCTIHPGMSGKVIVG